MNSPSLFAELEKFVVENLMFQNNVIITDESFTNGIFLLDKLKFCQISIGMVRLET